MGASIPVTRVRWTWETGALTMLWVYLPCSCTDTYLHTLFTYSLPDSGNNSPSGNPCEDWVQDNALQNWMNSPLRYSPLSLTRGRMGYADPTAGRDLLGNRSLCFIFICAFGVVTLLQQILYGKNYIRRYNYDAFYSNMRVSITMHAL